MALPTTPQAITAESLNQYLPDSLLNGNSVTEINAVNIGEGTGIFGEIARMKAPFGGPGSGGHRLPGRHQRAV